MAEEAAAQQFTLNIKGPSDLKLSVTVPSDATVEQLKEAISKEKEEFPVDQQRLIFSGRVLKNEDPITKYGIKQGVAIHLVKGAKPAGQSGASGSSSTPASRLPSEAAGVPSNFAAGQQVMGNPLAPLMNAQYAGALGGFNPFADMGVNTNDPNFLQSMMNSPEVQQQMNQMLQDPAVIDQMIAMNPQLQQMGPYVRQMMQSEQFRNLLTNPQAMQNAMQMMGGAGGMGGGAGAGLGGMGGMFPPPGAFGGGGGAGAGTGSTAASPSTPGQQAGGGANSAGATAPNSQAAPPPFNPFAMLGGLGAGAGPGPGAGGQQPDFAQAMAQMQQLFGGGAAGGGGGGARAGQSPEERYAVELEQLSNMGFTNPTRNVRALLASGGFVEGAIQWLFDNPE
ncbi:hypothetical protein JCM8115_005091 [Rhodotorula mucilaginosa]|uniref:Ubiquilin n=1 Tax=Rhodotorula mucilaginosa TaxID=5537 RepID=A0A9P6W8X7_RHOMI|nr:hypothetical protein C6P46_000156 [Rhodotorula mucilaginosa]TKA58449.1 hypothetical protein B0A53_00188 [Rhodotorula sp. CCFEE 5036]